MGKRKKNRKQQLREIQQRRLRYQPKLPQNKFSFARFLSDHLSEILFFLIFITAFVFVYGIKDKIHQSPDSQRVEALTSSVSPEQIQVLEKTYPQGFRVFAIAQNEILPLNINTLPKEFRIEWGVSKIIRIDRDEIRFRIGPVWYGSNNLASSLPVKLPRRQGKAYSSVVLNDIELTIELLAQYDTGIFCAFGFKKR